MIILQQKPFHPVAAAEGRVAGAAVHPILRVRQTQPSAATRPVGAGSTREEGNADILAYRGVLFAGRTRSHIDSCCYKACAAPCSSGRQVASQALRYISTRSVLEHERLAR